MKSYFFNSSMEVYIKKQNVMSIPLSLLMNRNKKSLLSSLI